MNKDAQEESVPQFLHKNVQITSDRQKSSQGTVFYFKFNQPDPSGEPGQSIECILKVYPQNEQETYDKEEKILRQIQARQFSGFPRIISSIKGVNQSEMILEALGPNLRHLLEASPKRHFSKATTLLITIQLIERIRDLHSIGWMHNDIKLENILIGYKDPAKIYLIDFGLSQPFVDFQTGYHVQKINLSYFSGNFMFASLNSCRGNNKSRRDDIESIFYLMIYLYNNNFLPWRDFKGTFKQMIVQRLQLRVTKSLFRMIPPCLEECLKYVLLLNFDEEPKYNYLIDQLKNAYYNEVAAAGEKINPNAIKQPIFEWNVSLATRFNKAQNELESQWMHGERAVSMSNMDVISTSMMKSRMLLNLNGSNYDSDNNGSANMNLDNSPHHYAENKQMMDQINNMQSQGSDNLDSGNTGLRRPLFQRTCSFSNHGSANRFSTFKPFQEQSQANRTSHSPMQQRHQLIENGLLKQRNKGTSQFKNLSENQSDLGKKGSQVVARKSSFYGRSQQQPNVVRNKNSSFAIAKGKLPSDQEEKLSDEEDAMAEDSEKSKSQESFSDDSDYATPRNNNNNNINNDMNELRKQMKNNVQISDFDHSNNPLGGQSTTEQTQSSSGHGNIPSQECDERVNQFHNSPQVTQHIHHHHNHPHNYQHQIYQSPLQQQQALQQQQYFMHPSHVQQQQYVVNSHDLAAYQNQQNYQLLLQQQQQQYLQQQLLQQQLLQQQQQQYQQQMIHPLIQQLPPPNFAAASPNYNGNNNQAATQPQQQQNQNAAVNQPYFRVMKVNQNDLKQRGSGRVGSGTNSPLNVRQPANIDDDMMID